MFKAFGYILYAPRSTHQHSGRRVPMWSSHTTTLKPTTWVRCCVAHSRTTYTHTHTRRQCVAVNSRELFTRLSRPYRVRQKKKKKTNNWLYVYVISSRAHTKWGNVDGDNDGRSGGANGKKYNHWIVDVNRELTMTSRIKWPPLPWTIVWVWERVCAWVRLPSATCWKNDFAVYTEQ